MAKTTIQIQTSTRQRLMLSRRNIAGKIETYDDVINRTLDLSEKKK